MHPSTVFALLLAAGASAQSSAVLLIPYGIASTVTVKGSDASATTYENVCAPSSSGAAKSAGASSAATSRDAAASSILQDSSSSATAAAGTLELTPITALPSMTAAPKPRRRQDTSSDDDEGFTCNPFIMTQGPETWEFHMTYADEMTIDANCNFPSGGPTSADATCTGKQSGPLVETPGTDVATMHPSDWADASAYATVSVVGEASQATGMANSLPLPTGAAAFVGGAAGILAAAMAL